MDNTLFGAIIQVAGFILLCRLGGRVSDRLANVSRWLPIAIGGLVIGGGILVCYLVGHPLGFVAQTAAFYCVAFGGGIVARQHDLIVRRD